jgi:hypothetical protein
MNWIFFCRRRRSRRRRRSSVVEKKEDLPSMTNIRWWNKRMHSVRGLLAFRRHHGQTANSKESKVELVDFNTVSFSTTTTTTMLLKSFEKGNTIETFVFEFIDVQSLLLLVERIPKMKSLKHLTIRVGEDVVRENDSVVLLEALGKILVSN